MSPSSGKTKSQYYYLVHIQYLGFRFHGWAKQPQVKTVHHMIDRTLKYVLGDLPFKTLGCSRTDAMVSAIHFAFELFVSEPLKDNFLDDFNLNLPADIRALELEAVDADFNIIQNPKVKEYAYLFAFGHKTHPFSAPFITTIIGQLNISLMQQGARLFEGKHYFGAYCKKPKEQTQVEREILSCQIVPNELLTANFFPDESWVLLVTAQGFLRNQIRMMMAQLFRLGKGDTDLEWLKQSLQPGFDLHLSEIAPASGLMLQKVLFDR